MGDYTAPSWKDVNFEFTTGGYSAPSFQNVNFQWLSTLTGVFNLGASLTAVPPKDLPTYIKSTVISFADIAFEITPFHPRDLGGIIGSVHKKDLSAFLRTIPPKDLPAFIRGSPPTDLPAFIVGWAERELGAYIFAKQYRNLGAVIRGPTAVRVPRDLGAYTKGWCYDSPFDLGAYIFGPVDLRARIVGMPLETFDLGAYLKVYPMKQLPAFIHGWQEVDLGGLVTGITDKQKDLPAILNVNPWTKLYATIRAMQSRDLGAIINRVFPIDLSADITGIGGVIDLPAFILGDGFANLGAIITPRLIKLAVLMPVHTMEYLDLGAVISLQPCYNQGIADLGAYMKIFQKHDLSAHIYGFPCDVNDPLFGPATCDYVRDLMATIAVGDYIYDKDTVDDLTITFTTYAEALALDDLPITWFDMVSPTDELSVCFKPGGGCKIPTNLLAAIIGHNPNFDLAAYINGVVQAPYIFGDPIFGPWDVDTLFTAPYIYNNRVLWERLVQISFFSQVYDYFYQSVTDSLWKDDDSEKWVLNVESWLEEETYLRDRTSLREKIVGDVTDFESVDEAVRHAIDWVISFPTKDLGAQISGITPPYADLAGRINPFKTYTKSYDLIASVIPFHTRDLSAQMQIVDEWLDLGASLTVT